MHQYARASLFQPSEGGGGDEDRRISLRDLLEFARRWRRTIVWVTLLFFVGATAYTFFARPLFTAVAQVMLDPSQVRGMLDDDPNRAPPLPADQARVESHIEIIKSDQLALDVIRKLQLTKLPDFDAPKGMKDREGFAVLVFEHELTARRVGQSLVIEIAFRFRDPVLAASIVNGLVDAYIAREMQVKSDAVERADRWLYDKQAGLDRQTQEALAALAQYKAQPEGAPDRAAKIEELQSRAQTYQRMHDAYLQKFNEAIQKVAFPEPDARVIAPAVVPLQKSYPKRGLIIGLATLLGLGIGVLLAVVRQNLDQTVRSPSQLAGLGDCFGVVSDIPAVTPIISAAPKRSDRGSQILRRKSRASADPLLHVVAEYPSSTVTKEFRSIKIALDCAMDGQKCQLIGVVAAREREGATTVAANLAAVYAGSGLRTLIVDSCPENPALTREFLDGPEQEAARKNGGAHTPIQMSGHGVAAWLSVLRAGHVSWLEALGAQPASRSGGDLETLRDGYEAVIVDLPGLERSADARAIARFLDAIIVVAEAQSSPLDAVHGAVESLRAARAPVVGIVLNKVRRPGTRAHVRRGMLAAILGTQWR